MGKDHFNHESSLCGRTGVLTLLAAASIAFVYSPPACGDPGPAADETAPFAGLTKLAWDLPFGGVPSARQFVEAEGPALVSDLGDLTVAALEASPPGELSDEALLGLATLHALRGDGDGAAEAARALLARAPAGPLAQEAAIVLGFALLDSSAAEPSGLEESLGAFDRGLELSEGGSSLAGYGRALALWNLAERAEAMKAAEGVLVHEPTGPVSERARVLFCTLRRSAPLPGEGESYEPDTGVEELTPEQRERMESNPDAVQAPEKIYYPAPGYTEVARRSRLQGRVVIRTIIDRYGCVATANVQESLGLGLDQSALGAVRSWVFRPATFAGAPVSVYYDLTVNFRLDSTRPPG